MKQIDISDEGIFEIAWSPDSKWVTYVRKENEVCLANVESGDIRVVGQGASPGFSANNSIVMERDDEIVLISSGGEQILSSTNDLVKDSAKRAPMVSPDGKKVVFSVNNVFDKESQDKNAYAFRHFLAIAHIPGQNSDRSSQQRIDEQWYGGVTSWFPSNETFVHFEYDSTGGARIHVISIDGKSEGTMFGLYPSVSPDGKHIVCKPKSAGNIVVYTNQSNTWEKNSIRTSVYKIPQSDGKLTGTSPQWIDNRFVLVDEGGKLWRIDTRKEDATEMTKYPIPTSRGKSTMIISPSKELLAVETNTDKGFALQIVTL